MSKTELERCKILEQLDSGRIFNGLAAKEMGLSIRHVQRLKKRYREGGAEAITHAGRGKSSPRGFSKEKRNQIIEKLHDRYPDFGATLAKEKLFEEYDIQVSTEYVRQQMIKEALHKPKKRKKNNRYHPRRPRRSRAGELVQIDGSLHKWFEDRAAPCCLLAFIDDATSRILFAKFVDSESFLSYARAMKTYFEQFGLPASFYSDKLGVFRVNNKEANARGATTQLVQNLKKLDVEVICANSPQAKGRIERSFGTHQDRLVKEMRLASIDTMEKGNSFLEEYVLKHNANFSVPAARAEDAHRPLSEAVDLNISLGREISRKLSRDLSFQYERTLYQAINIEYPRRAAGTEVIVHEALDGTVTFSLKGEPLQAVPFTEYPAPQQVLDAKELGAQLENKKQPKPHKHHPWR